MERVYLCTFKKEGSVGKGHGANRTIILSTTKRTQTLVKRPGASRALHIVTFPCRACPPSLCAVTKCVRTSVSFPEGTRLFSNNVGGIGGGEGCCSGTTSYFPVTQAAPGAPLLPARGGPGQGKGACTTRRCSTPSASACGCAPCCCHRRRCSSASRASTSAARRSGSALRSRSWRARSRPPRASATKHRPLASTRFRCS